MNNQRILRSKAQGSQVEKANMATANLSQHEAFKAPATPKGERTDKQYKGDKLSTTKQKMKEAKMSPLLHNKASKKLFTNEIVKGHVAEMVESMNSTPQSSPTHTEPSSSTKKKMLSARNGQLVIQEDDDNEVLSLRAFKPVHKGQAGANYHELQADYNLIQAYQHDQTEYSADETVSEDETTDNEEKQNETEVNLASILRELSSTVKSLEKAVRKINKECVSQEKKVSAIETVQSQDSVKIRGLIEKVDDQEDKINTLMGVVTRQDILIRSLASKIDASYVKENRNNILIYGIPETQGEDCYHEAANFFKNILKLDNAIPLTQAYRIGKGNKRPILAKLKNVNDKTAIYAKTDRLKQLNKSRDRPYFITDQLPEAWAEQKRTNHFFKQQNTKLPVAQQQNVQILKGKLMVDGRPFETPISTPTVRQMCSLSPERKAVLRGLKFIEGNAEEQDKSTFVGYAADVYSTEAVQRFYDAMFLLVPDATHIMCAFKLPGVDIVQTQGYLDDGEHGGGRVLLNILNKNKTTNKALFVTRHYGGQHIGAARFQLIEKAAFSALQRIMDIEKRNKQPLTDEELVTLNRAIAEQAAQKQEQERLNRQHPWNVSEEEQADSDNNDPTVPHAL